MQSQPSPSAHVCTTLPPGDLPVRDMFPDLDTPDHLTYVSECGRVRRSYFRTFNGCHGVPAGTWWPHEVRTDDKGEEWAKRLHGVCYVVDDFGFLTRADGKGGAA